jgi:serine/threonine protein kinase
VEIKLVARQGVPPSEIDAHRQIEDEFNATPFTKQWQGFAAFALARKGWGAGDDDFDLVLLTHTNVLVIELKNWNGRELTSDGHKWYLDGKDRGTSPVETSGLKAKRLASELKKKLGEQRVPYVASFVVLHGSIRDVRLEQQEEQSVLTLTQFLSLRFESEYRRVFRPGRVNPLQHVKAYEDFFLRAGTKPRDYLIEGFRPDTNPIFEHPDGLYREFRGVAKDDAQARALIRQWDFTKKGAMFAGEADRAAVGLREQWVHAYVEERSEELSLALLRPLVRRTQHDASVDFCEVFSLPPRVTRLAEFIHSALPEILPADRLALTKVLIARCAELHDLLVAHRDLSTHSVWLDVPPKVVLSGFSTAYFPERKTVGAFRDKVKVDQLIVPSSSGEAEPSPYHRDAFMLGVVAHLLLFGEKPPAVQGKHFWQRRAEDPYAGSLNAWFERALASAPAERFANAREMLNTLNSATVVKSVFEIKPEDLEAFKADTRVRDYPVTQSIADDEYYECFKSVSESGSVVVKEWFGVDADMKHPEGAFGALTFLERARAFRSSGLPGVPRIVDFGLSRGSLLLVQEWADGKPLPQWLEGNPDYEQRVALATSLLDTIDRLHDLDLAHGDVHPANVICRATDAVLIDALDYRRRGEDAYTTAYLPANYKSMSPADRDRYGALAVVAEIMGTDRGRLPNGPYPVPEVYKALAESLRVADAISTAPVRSALDASGRKSKDDPAYQGELTLRGLSYAGFAPGELYSDNGSFHVAVSSSKRGSGVYLFRITGIGFELRIDWDLARDCAVDARIVRLSQGQFLRNQIHGDAKVTMRLTASSGAANDVDDLVHFLLRSPAIRSRLGVSTREPSESDGEGSSPAKPPEKGKVAAIWSALLEAEDASFPTVVVAELPRPNRYKPNQELVLCHLESGVLDFSPNELVLVENKDQNNQWRQYGRLNFRDSAVSEITELAIDYASGKANVRIGAQLRLVSAGNKGSLNKRRSAVNRILDDKATAPGLLRYFDPAIASEIEPIAFPGPTSKDLQTYATGAFGLNANQLHALSKVLSVGPISLLQGPPGTGKTTFIAAMLHLLITKEKARRILLVSQTHEAVNNALEKASDVFRLAGLPFAAVRLGAQSVVSEPIRSLSADSVEQFYREAFRAEQSERLARLGTALGMPGEFCRRFVALQLQLGAIARRIAQLGSAVGDDDAMARKRLQAQSLHDTFMQIARSTYGHIGEGAPDDVLRELEREIVEAHNVLSRDAVERLRRLVDLSESWVSVLGAPEGNFVEFLARARTVVAGTCVGIAQRGAGVTENIYDWVIIDEAGRAAPSELAVALQTGRRILLVGDHRQLPPTFSPEVIDTVLSRFGGDSDLFSSDFARVFDSSYGEKAGATLTSQYRMAGAIGKVVSECFYNGMLDTARGPSPPYYGHLPASLSKNLTWVDTSPYREKSYEQQLPNDDAISNELEARVIVGILKKILESEKFTSALAEDLEASRKGHEVPVGIICFYSKQRDVINRLLSEEVGLADRRRWVKVDTVDGYQGKENRIIILSTVRNNPQGRVGFLRSPNRINVAMSRAMERLVIVGSKSMWSGANRSLPLGQVLSSLEALTPQGEAAIQSAEDFL